MNASSLEKDFESSSEPRSSCTEKACPKGDFSNILLLIVLYVMQGIPLGLTTAVPYLLQANKNTANYNLQATFYLSQWPFSLKLIWAPLVDALYCKRFGRRKSWLVPIQYAIGIDLLVLASHVDEWLGREPDNPWGPLGVTHPVNIYSITAAFFGLTFLAATQDIAVDGWAITMLSKRNLGWASTCNAIGQTLGIMISFVLFLFLESPLVANGFSDNPPVNAQGFITFSGFLYFWGIAFMVVTTVVAIFKQEENAVFTRPIQNCMNGMTDKIRQSSAARKLRTASMSLRPRPRGRTPKSVPSEVELTDITDLAVENSSVESDETSEIHATNGFEVLDDETMRNGALMQSGSVFEVLPSASSDESPLTERSMNEDLSLCDTYRVTFGILWLKPILVYIILLLFVKFCFAAHDSITTLKYLEHGVSKERLAFLTMLLVPLQAALPLLITRWTNGPRPLGVFTWAGLLRLLITILAIPLVYYTPSFRHVSTEPAFNGTTGTATNSPQYSFTWSFYGIVLVYTALSTIVSNFMFISAMSFHARISDPAVGGTYMTLLNTAANLAGTLPSTLMLYLVDPLTIRYCTGADLLKAGTASWTFASTGNVSTMLPLNSTGHIPSMERLEELGQLWIHENATCKGKNGLTDCELIGGTCFTQLDGYYLQVGFSVALGLITFPLVARRLANYLDALSPSAFSFHLPKHACWSKIRRKKTKKTNR